MKRIVLPALVSLASVLSALAAESPFQLQVPEGWKLTVNDQMEFHTFMIGAGAGVMMLSKWPAPTKAEDIPKTVKTMADKFAVLAKSKGLALKKDEAVIGEIKGDLLQGSFALFELKEPADNVQTTFLVHDGKGGVYNGQFTGKTADWEKGLALLKSAKAK